MKTIVKATRSRVKDVADLQRKGKIYLDEAFQSNARWGTISKQAYWQSVIEGRATSAITIARITDLRSAVEDEYGKQHEDYEILTELLAKGFEYITIDGNNRTRCLLAFLENEFPLKEVSYDTGDIGFRATKNNKYYKELSPELKDYVDNIEINLHVVKQCDREGLSKLFTSINEGMTLNDQEKRNAIFSRYGNAVRACVDENKSGFSKMYSSSQVNRRFPDEFVVTVSNFVAHGLININKTVRDEAYGDNTAEYKSFHKTKKIVKQICDMVVKYGKGNLKAGGKFKSSVLDLAILLRYMNANNIVINDFEKFYEFFGTTQEARIADPTILWDNAKRDKFGNIVVGKDGTPEKEATDQRSWIGIQKNLQKNFLVIREEKLIQSLSECPDGVITFRDRDRSFDAKIRRVLWEQQDGKCAITDTEIPFSDVFNGDKVHIDHIIPWSKGGSTTMDNAQLVLAEANLQKAAKLEDELPSLDEV